MPSFQLQAGRIARPLFQRQIPFAALTVALLLSAASAAFAHEFKVGDIEITHPWSRATPPGAKVAGGYFVLENDGAAPDRLVSATAEIAGRTQIHEMAVTNGVMTMRELPDGVVVPAKGEVAFKPGSYHLMLMDLKQPLKQGEKFSGTLTFEKAGTVIVVFDVAPIGSPDQSDSGHDGHTMPMP